MYSIERFTIPEIIEKSSRHYADRPALAMVGGKPLSYAELEPRSRRIAALLGLLGVRKGDRVAILSENRPEWGLAYLGVSRTGAVAVPIMTDFSAEQVANIIEHSGSSLVLVSSRFLGKIEAESGRRTIVSIEDFSLQKAGPGGVTAPSEAEIERAASAFEEPWIEADDLASILYTSGTMGRSKGVMLSHRIEPWREHWRPRSPTPAPNGNRHPLHARCWPRDLSVAWPRLDVARRGGGP